MIYTLKNTSEAGDPARFYDGNGQEIPDPVYVDTLTGRVEGHLKDADSRNMENGGMSVRYSATVKLPIAIKWLSKTKKGF